MGNNKKAFDSARSSLYVMDPTTELAIAGALNKEFNLPKDQIGDNDTECDKNDPLYDERIGLELSEEMIANVDAYGVIVPVTIVKRDGKAFVLAGRQRVRAARVVNKRRAKRGEPLLTVKCDIKRDDDAGLLGNMISENEMRTADDQVTKVEKLKRLLARGVSLDDAAVTMGKSPTTLQGWLDYDDHAIPALKKAVESGKLNQTAASSIAKLKDPEKQSVALEKLLASVPAGGRITRNKAKTAAKKASKPDANMYEMTDRRSHKKLLKAIQELDHARHGEKTLAFFEGVENALKLIIGTDELDSRLANVVDKLGAEEK